MTNVTIKTRTVGQSFGTVGVLCDARTGRKVAVTETVRPYGFTAAAVADAEELAARLGHGVAEGGAS